jgi:hypothetical protein
MPDPEKFHGDRAKLPDFLTQVRLKLLANRDRCLNENAMTMYVISRLDGAALHQIATFINGVNIDFASPEALLTYLETSFGDPDPTGTARHELHELKQTKDFSAYLTEFRRIMGKLRYDDATQMDALETGLSNKLKETLVITTRPDTMAEYERQLLALDNRIQAREEEKRGSRNTTGQFATTTATPSSFTPGGLAPMDLSATQWQSQNNTPRPPITLRHELINSIKRTTPAEKAWRRVNGKCDFCREGGHAFGTCPKKQNRPRNTMYGAAASLQSNNPFSHALPPQQQPSPPQILPAPQPPAGFQ